MKITKQTQGSVTIVSISGSLDALTARELERFLQQEIGAGNSRLVADLAELEYTSSAGLRVLLTTVRECRARGGDLRLAAVQENVDRVLEMSGLTTIFKIYPDRATALSDFEPVS